MRSRSVVRLPFLARARRLIVSRAVPSTSPLAHIDTVAGTVTEQGRQPRIGRPTLFGSTAGLAAGALVAGLLSVAVAAPASAALADGLVLWYKLDEASGAVAADSSGNARNGTVIGTAGWGGAQGLAFDGSTTYVKTPDSPMNGLTSITVATDVWVDPAQAAPYFIYGFGNTTSWYGDGYLFGTGNPHRSGVASGNWSTEQVTASSTNLARGGWKHIAYTQTGSTAVLYEDGVEVARNTAVTITPGSIGGGTTTVNQLGRSNYPGDNLLSGKLRDFRMYDRALDATEVGELAVNAVTEAIPVETAALTLGDTTAVTADLALPTTGSLGAKITWATSDAGVVDATGKVTRPANGSTNGTATLTATLTKGGVTDTKAFAVTVLTLPDDTTIAKAAAAALVVHNVDDVRGNLTLPTAANDASTVTWSSSDPAVITATGEVKRPAAGAATATVTLTASVTHGTATVTRDFAAKVPALPAPAPKTGYMFTYFTGEGTADGEQMYFALSRGNDPLNWRELNNGKPVLTSNVGEKGLRDPFITRSPEGDKYYLIATDLRIYGGNGWDAAQRTGSKSLLVWESTDLVNWTNQRLVKVSPDTAGNTWAPEAFWDPSQNAYVVYWASKLYDPTDTAHTGSTYNKMMYTTTRDFYTFSEPKVWKDPGYSVIDSTVTEHNGTYYRFTKDERNNTSSTPCSKFIIEEKTASLLDTNWGFVSECIGKPDLGAGEGPTVFKANNADKWYLFIDEFGGRGYVPFSSTNLDSGKWTMETTYSLPAKPRHGTVMGVTKAEYQRLLATYGAGPDPDLTAPETSISVSPAAPSSGWNTSGVQVTVTATDDVDSAVTPEAKITGPGFTGQWAPLSGPLTLSSDGVFGIDYRATDSSGNVAAVKSTTVKIDATQPVSKSTVNTTARTVTLLAADSASGVSKVEYSLDTGATWLAYGGPVTVGRSTATVMYRAVDVAGNVEDANTVVVASLLAASTTKADLTPSKVAYGKAATVNVKVTGGRSRVVPSGTVRVLNGAVEVGSGRLSSSGWVTIKLAKDIPVGTNQLVVRYDGNATYDTSSATVTLTAVKSRSTTSMTLSSTMSKVGRSVTAKLTVTSDAGIPVVGSVTVQAVGGGLDLTYTAQLDANGKATITVGPFVKTGNAYLVAAYSGSDTVDVSRPGKAKVTVK